MEIKTKYIDGELQRVVDLSKNIERIMVNGHKEFLKNINETTMMEMSFSRGEVFVVDVEQEAEESTENDPKFNVTVIARLGKPWGSDWSHTLGEKRWVRTYDLKPVGYYWRDLQ